MTDDDDSHSPECHCLLCCDALRERVRLLEGRVRQIQAENDRLREALRRAYRPEIIRSSEA